MSPMKPLVLSLFALLGAASVLAEGQEGREGGNGGGAIVCYHGGATPTVRLLDLWEADQAKLKVPRSNRPVKEQFDRALDWYALARPFTAKRMTEILRDVRRVEKKPGDRLLPPSDTGLDELHLPINCSLQGVARFDDREGTLTIDPLLHRLMSKTDQAALEFHEALYRAIREGEFPHSDSINARILTGQAFVSRHHLASQPADAGLEKATYECDSLGKHHFYIIPEGGKQVRLQFTRVLNRELTELATATIDYEPDQYPKGYDGRPIIETMKVRARHGFANDVFPWFEGAQYFYAPAPHSFGAYISVKSKNEPAIQFHISGGDELTDCGSKQCISMNSDVKIVFYEAGVGFKDQPQPNIQTMLRPGFVCKKL